MKFSIFTLLLFGVLNLFSQSIKVEIVQQDDQWTLLRGGVPYYINGAGGAGNIDVLKAAGGNSIRIWSAENAQEILDEAYKNGLTVMFGLWVQHERHGFDYNDEVAVQKQLEYFTQIVEKFKDHPALLFWSVGNEVDLMYSNFKVWDAVQDIAAMIHRIDPNHPTSTVTAGLHEQEVKLVMDKCPDIDIFGVNTYSEACTIAQNIRNFGWSGPYIISEWGPDGHWEVPKVKWNAPVEQTSHEKAIKYQERYLCIKNDKNMCLGSYVFLWGQKQETTATWYGVFTDKGEYTEVIDFIAHSWSGKWPINRAPQLIDVFLDKKKNGEDIYLSPENKYVAKVFASDDNDKKLIYIWEVIPESADLKAGGDVETAPVPVQNLFVKQKRNKLIFNAPKEKGAYRLFVKVYDSEGKVAYANIPFYVE